MNKRLHVSNLPFNLEEDDLRQLFSDCGKVIDIYMPVDKVKNWKKGFAFVEMNQENEAAKAISSLNQSSIKDRTITVTYALERNTQSNNNSGGENRTRQSSFNSHSPNSRSRNKMRDENINESLFIRKACDIKPVEPYIPVNSFSSFDINSKLKENIITHGYTKPTEIQDQVIPEVLLGKDVIGLANTGTGKTAAFLVPLINKILNDRTQKVLIIVPTRELGLQIIEELRIFSKNMPIRSVLVIGGANMDRQISTLRTNPEFVIGTPGRLKDLSTRKSFYLSQFNNLVIDEVDRMLDMGFIKEIKEMTSKLSSDRQSLFFSATMPKEIHDLAITLLHNPITISVVKGPTPNNVDQDIIRVSSNEDKIEALHDLLIKPDFQKVLIFHRTKHGVDKLSKQLISRGFNVAAIHGGKPQGKRQNAIQSFKDRRVKILIATDVASRGIDIEDVSHVINYELPATYDDYVHRIGRTGRADKKGTAITFVNKK